MLLIPASKYSPPLSGSESEFADILGLVYDPYFALGFSMPADTIFKESVEADVYTKAITQLTIYVFEKQVSLRFAPYIFLDAFGPTNVMLFELRYKFGDSKITINARYDRDWTPTFGILNTVEEKVQDFINIFNETPLAEASYNPFQDSSIIETLNKISENIKLFSNSFGSEGSSDNFLQKFDNVKLEFFAKIKQSKDFPDNGDAKVRLVKDATLHFKIFINGSVQEFIDNYKNSVVSEIAISSSGILLNYHNKDVLKITNASFFNGAKFRMNEFEIMNETVKNLEDTGSAIRLISLIALFSKGGNTPRKYEVFMNTNRSIEDLTEPKLIQGLTQSAIEEMITQQLIVLIKENQNTIPEFDLVKSIGLQ
jgi:hypothetical protein